MRGAGEPPVPGTSKRRTSMAGSRASTYGWSTSRFTPIPFISSRGVRVPFPGRMAIRRRCLSMMMVRVPACGLVVSDGMDHPFNELKTGILSEDGPGYSCFLVLVVPPVQRRTSDAWASIILCVSLVACARYSDSHLVCQHFIESLSFHSPQDGMGLPPLAWSRKEAFAIQPERCA